MKILFLASKFDPGGANPYLTDELCEALVEMGHTVDVIFLDWSQTYQGPNFIQRDRLRIHFVSPAGGTNGIFNKAIKWGASAYRALSFYKRNFRSNEHELLISFSPSIVFSVLLLGLKSRIKARVLVQWDFFPFHQAQIGLVPFQWMTSLAAKIETLLMNSFCTIACMSPRNVAYLREHYAIDQKIRTEILPIWSKVRPKPQVDRRMLRNEYAISQESFVAVFGGQLTAGRGIENIVEMAKLAFQRSSKVSFLVIGAGPKAEWLATCAKELHGYLRVLPSVARNNYLSLVAACDVGLVVTVPNVDVPSFPSKTLDYCCAAIPVVAAVEKSTDFGEIIAAAGFARYCDAGDSLALLEILEQLASDPNLCAAMGVAAREQYETYFNVNNVAALLMSMVQDV